MDRVRAAVFSSLAAVVPDARVLDLYAGSGAYGIEALSRGAAAATFVDNQPNCAAVIRANLAHCGFSASVQTMEAGKFLDLYGCDGVFDLIFADPPYAKEVGAQAEAARLLQHPALPDALAPKGVLVLESHAVRPMPIPEPWQCLRDRNYGASRILFLRL